jgi:O-antigen/teichoic acid export membrane protein
MSLQASTAELNRSFRHGFTLTFTADLFAKALSAVTVVVLIRGLTVSAYAYTTLFLTLAQFAGAAAGGGVRTRYLREEAESFSRGAHSKQHNAHFLTSLIKGTLLIAAVGVCAVPLVGPLHVGSRFGASASLVLYAAAFAVGFGATELAIAHYQARRRFAVAGILGLIRAAALLVAAVLISLTHQSVQLLSISFVTSMVVVGLATALPIARTALGQRVPSARTLTLGREENWLSIYYLASAGFAYVDVLVASALLHQKQVASLGATIRYLTIVLAAAPALGAILRVRTAQADMIDSHEAQRAMLLRWMRVGAAPTVLCMVLGVALAPLLIPIIDGGRYPQSIVAFQIFLVTAASSYLTAPAPSLLMAQRRYRALAAIFFTGLCVNLVGDVLVARRLGVVGIAVVSSSVYVALDAVMTLDALRHASAAARKRRFTPLVAIAIRLQCLLIALREWWDAALPRHRRRAIAEDEAVPSTLIALGPPLTSLAVLGTLTAAVLGFAIARSGGSDVPRRTGETQASSGLLQLAVPVGWHYLAAGPVQQLALSDELLLRSPRADGGTLLVGRDTTGNPTAVARSFVGKLPQASTPQQVLLAGARFIRYATTPARAKWVYVLPTTVGTVVGVCVAGESGPSFSATCERILDSIRVRAAGASATFPAGYATGLIAAISRLNAVRASAGAELAAARDARHEELAARKLAAAHADAAATLLRLDPGPAAGANAAVAAALRTTSDSYSSLAAAAARSDARGYANASASLRHANTALKVAFLRLRVFGLRVG